MIADSILTVILDIRSTPIQVHRDISIIKIVYIIAHVLDLKNLPKLGIRDLSLSSSEVLVQLSGVLVIGVFLYSFLVIGVSAFGHRNQVVQLIPTITPNPGNLYSFIDYQQVTQPILVQTELLGIAVLINNAHHRKVGYKGIDDLKLPKVRALGVFILIPFQLSTLISEVSFFTIIIVFSFLSRGFSTLLLLRFALKRV